MPTEPDSVFCVHSWQILELKYQLLNPSFIDLGVHPGSGFGAGVCPDLWNYLSL